MPIDAYWAVFGFTGWICALIAHAYARSLAKENAGLRGLIGGRDE